MGGHGQGHFHAKEHSGLDHGGECLHFSETGSGRRQDESDRDDLHPHAAEEGEDPQLTLEEVRIRSRRGGI